MSDTHYWFSVLSKYHELELQIQDQTRIPAIPIDIGNGILLSKDVLTTIRSVSTTMNVYARNMFKHLFKPHDVIGYSLMGKGCNANRSEKQPSIDPVRRDAIIGIVEYCIVILIFLCN